MLRLLLPLSVLAACTPSPRKAVMPSPSPISGNIASGPGGIAPQAQAPTEQASSADSPAAALGRRTLSTAFVRVGPDGHLTVDLQDGRALVLRDVVMRPKDYCGVQLSGKRYCGGYAEVAAARPGGAPPAGQPEAAAGPPAKPLP